MANFNLLMIDTFYVLDFETSGLSHFPDTIPIEVAIFEMKWDYKQEVWISHCLLDEFFDWSALYKEEINGSWWSRNTGIDFGYVKANATTSIVDLWEKIKLILDGKYVISWNTDFDFGKILIPMMEEYPSFELRILDCPMKKLTEILQIRHVYYGYKYPTLDDAMQFYQVSLRYDVDGNSLAHRSYWDTAYTCEILNKAISENHYRPKVDIKLNTKSPLYSDNYDFET